MFRKKYLIITLVLTLLIGFAQKVDFAYKQPEVLTGTAQGLVLGYEPVTCPQQLYQVLS